MKAFNTIALLFTITIAGFAQKRNVYYLTNGGRYVTNRDSADYVRIIQEPDSGTNLYNVFDLYKDGAKKLIGKSSRVSPVVFQGQVAQFYPDGKKKQIANYVDNKLVGLFYQFYPNGKIFSVVTYYQGIYTNPYAYSIITCLDTAGHEIVKDGNGHYIGFDGGGNGVWEEGDVKESLRVGDWKGSVAALGITFTEHYEEGKLIDGTAIDKTGVIHTYTERSADPYYREGKKALFKAIINRVNLMGMDEIENVNGTAIISFFIDEKKRITDVTILNSESKTLNDYFSKAMIMSAKGWVPGAFFGVPLKEHVSFPYSIQTEDSKAFY